MNLLSSRQVDLKNQISDAMGSNDKESLILLQSKWIHRYGVDTLPKTEVTLSDSDFIKDVEENENKNNISFDLYTEKKSIEELGNQIYQTNKELQKENSLEEIPLDKNVKNNFIEQNVDLSSNENPPSNSKILNNKTLDIAPPPRPTLSYFRKWIPSSSEEKKAS